MSEPEPEPRRSVRATKGQHKALEQMDAQIETPKRRGKKGKKAAPEPEEPEVEIIRCVCGATEQDEDSGEPWIACDKCGAWQHNICMGLSKYSEDLPEKYFCEICRPDNHTELLAGIRGGERPWEARRRAYEEEIAGKKKRGGKRGKKRQSDQKEEHEKLEKKSQGSSVPPTASSPAPTLPTTLPPTPVPAPPVPATVAAPAPPPEPVASPLSADTKKEAKSVAGTKRKVQDEAHEKEVKQSSNKMRKMSDAQAIPAAPVSNPPTTATSTAPPASLPESIPTPAPAPATTYPISAPAPPAAAPIAPVAAPARASTYQPPSDLPTKATELPDLQRQNAAHALTKSLTLAMEALDKTGFVASSDGLSTAERAERYAIQIERAIREAHRTNTAYNAQCRTLSFNLKKNLELFPKLVNGELTPVILASMSSSELASKEKQKETAEMKARLDKQSIKITQDMPRMRKTHKGDEVIIDDNFVLHSEETPGPSIRRPSIRDQMEIDNAAPTAEAAKLPVHQEPAKAASPPKDLRIETKQASIRTEWSNIDKVFSSVPAGAPARKQSIPVVTAPGPVVDDEVDRMLDDGTDSPPYSPTEESDPKVVWRGLVSMPTIAEFYGMASYVAGSNLAEEDPPVSWNDLLPKQLSICGRIDEQKAIEYLCGLRYSMVTDVTVVSLEPTLDANKADFRRLWDYFIERKKYGVIADRNLANIRDTYLIPVVPGGPEKQPEFLLNLHDNFGPMHRTEPMLYVVIVHRSDEEMMRKKHGSMEPPTMSRSFAPLSASSVAQQVGTVPKPAPAFSPTSPQGTFPNPNYGPAQATPTPPVRNGHVIPSPEEQLRADAIAREVLGPYFSKPTAAFLRPQFHLMTRVQLETLRAVYERDPKTQTDHVHLNAILAGDANKRNQGKPDSPTAPEPAPSSDGQPGKQQQVRQYHQPAQGSVVGNHQAYQQPAQPHFELQQPQQLQQPHPHQQVQQPAHQSQPPHHPQSQHVPPIRQTPIPPPPVPHSMSGPPSIPPNAGGPPRQTPIPPPVIPPHAVPHAAAASSTGASS